MTAPEADLTGWTASPFSADGYTYDVYRKGEGPGVVLIPEMPGIHPGVLALGNHLVDNGFTVACPSLYGTPGAPGSDFHLADDEITTIRAAVQDLPLEQRQAIEMAFFGGKTHLEIAEELQEPLGTVKARIRRGMLKLRESLQAYV